MTSFTKLAAGAAIALCLAGAGAGPAYAEGSTSGWVGAAGQEQEPEKVRSDESQIIIASDGGGEDTDVVRSQEDGADEETQLVR